MNGQTKTSPSPAEHPLNYFTYFTEIEDAFVRRRGKHLMLSPMDWALIESWKEMQMPLHVALRGIERAFDSWEAKPRKRTVKSLLYCQEEVEAQYAEWLESRVGSATDSDDPITSDSRENEAMPFPPQAILDHLSRGRSALRDAVNKRGSNEDELTDAFRRAAGLLEELEEDFGKTTHSDAKKLEISLTGLERMLTDAIRIVVIPSDLERFKTEVKEQLRPYRRQMDKSVYEQTAENLLLKRLRKQFGVPRLSLFYL